MVLRLKEAIKESFHLSDDQHTEFATQLKTNLSLLKIALGCDNRTLMKLSEAVHFEQLGWGVRTLTARWLKELGVHKVSGCSKDELTRCARKYGYRDAGGDKDEEEAGKGDCNS